MGAFGAIYHSSIGLYKYLKDDADGCGRELDKAVDILHHTVALDPLGISDISDIVDDIRDKLE